MRSITIAAVVVVVVEAEVVTCVVALEVLTLTRSLLHGSIEAAGPTASQAAS